MVNQYPLFEVDFQSGKHRQTKIAAHKQKILQSLDAYAF